ncbi:MAG: beta-agarase [Planctomycetota bacterium]
MLSQQKMKWMAGAVFALGLPVASIAESGNEVVLKIDPSVQRSIQGISALDRESVFAMCDPGKGFDKRIDSQDRMKFLLNELNVSFGRQLGPVMSVVKWGGGVDEDPNRPGYADIAKLEKSLQSDEPGDLFRGLSGGRLDVVAHGHHNAYPEFMGQVTTDEAQQGHKPQYIPQNIEAAAELAAVVFEKNYNEFDRPQYYEPVNEPHWSFYYDRHMADWHVKTMEAVKKRTPEVLVGGPCSSVAYYYKRDFSAFSGLKTFMEYTEGKLDFYSFHVYDYMRWENEQVTGRITGGLPIEGVLDLVQSHSYHTYGQEFPLVISEHGGYFLQGVVPEIAEKYLPAGEGFEHTMRVRSIASHVLVSAAIANTLSFLEHPHVVKKAVPFILLESMNWDPEYYSTAYVPYNFTEKDNWVESRNLDFYRFFRDLEGERLWIDGGDPDLQAAAFIEGSIIRVVINNLSDEPHTVSLELPGSEDHAIRRYRRNDDYTPSLKESSLASLQEIQIDGREAIVIASVLGQEVEAKATINEVPFYAEDIQVVAEPGKPIRFEVEVESPNKVEKASVRIGVTRPPSASADMRVKFNGREVEVPLEDSAERYTNADEYASTKIIPIDPSLLKAKNRVIIAFPDDQGGAIGTVVIRAGYQK